MRFAVDIAPLGELADPAVIVRIARAAEASGWDGLSTWDVLGVSMDAAAADPFVALAGGAMATERLRLIASVIVLPRRRPQLVAQATATLDRLSGGRLVLGVGAGADEGDFTLFGERFAGRDRIESFYDSLALVDTFLREPAEAASATVARSAPSAAAWTIGPLAVQRPRPPIWIGGMRPRALRAAARLDGWIAVSIADDGVTVDMPPARFAELLGTLRAARPEGSRDALAQDGRGFDVAVFGQTGLAGTEPAEYAEAGATWWLETFSPQRASTDEIMRLVEAGPPR